MEKKRTVVVFDFDGTLTTKDTLLEFIKFARGKTRFFFGFLLYSPMLVLMKQRLYPNWKAKEHIFSWFFRGMQYDEFIDLGHQFSSVIVKMANAQNTSLLHQHILDKNDVYVITASIEEWVRPYCEALKVKEVLGTKVEVVDNVITGKFSTRNCYGKEKIVRLLEREPDRQNYYLYAYGDSRGDKYMIEFADKGIYV